MKLPINTINILFLWMAFVFIIPNTEAQTKQIKYPINKVGASSDATVIYESYDIYNKVYKYVDFDESGTQMENKDNSKL